MSTEQKNSVVDQKEQQPEQTSTTTTTEPQNKTEETTPEDTKPKRICSTEGCGKPAKLKCPTCSKFGGPDSFFCEQECFKTNWPIHSRCHAEMKKKFEFVPPKIKYTGPLRPAYVSPRVQITDPKIQKPDYAETGIPVSERTAKASSVAPVYTDEEVKGIRAACKLTRDALDYACSLIAPGVTTDEIDVKTHAFIIERGGYPSPLNYHNFPKSLCTSVNEVICHGIPDARPLENGDIINIDVSVYLGGFHGDANETHMVGECDFDSLQLMKGSWDSLQACIKQVKPNFLFRDFGELVSHSIKKHGFSSVKSYCGHGIGHLFHCLPNIPHYAKNKATGSCKPNMIFCIEPMINAGVWQDTHWPDNWTATTVDGKRSAQYEHCILCTQDGYEVLTARTENSKPFWWELPQYAAELEKYNDFVRGKAQK